MDTSVTLAEPGEGRKSICWSLAAFGISIVLLLWVIFVLRELYLDTASLPAGTEVRPMGATFQLGIAWTASIVFGGICALVGGNIARIQRRWRLFFFALLAAAATWVPMFVSNRGFDYVIAVRKLVLEP